MDQEYKIDKELFINNFAVGDEWDRKGKAEEVDDAGIVDWWCCVPVAHVQHGPKRSGDQRSICGLRPAKCKDLFMNSS